MKIDIRFKYNKISVERFVSDQDKEVKVTERLGKSAEDKEKQSYSI